jgi:2-C-methyl-D-erythritol 4-phosphate cytidylyltransferase
MAKLRIWCVIPAAGTGQRMGADRPKQYLKIAGRMVIEHTLEEFAGHPRIAGVTVALAPGDPWWSQVKLAGGLQVKPCEGGGRRFESVLSGLDALKADGADDGDLVLVHDAARPCVRREDIDRLVDAARVHSVGAVLGMPVRDSMKRTEADNSVRETVSRVNLWHAFTPQGFRLGRLRLALERALEEGAEVTDEAQAMERIGDRPLMVEGHADNLKITTPSDLQLAEHFLAARAASK